MLKVCIEAAEPVCNGGLPNEPNAVLFGRVATDIHDMANAMLKRLAGDADECCSVIVGSVGKVLVWHGLGRIGVG